MHVVSRDPVISCIPQLSSATHVTTSMCRVTWDTRRPFFRLKTRRLLSQCPPTHKSRASCVATNSLGVTFMPGANGPLTSFRVLLFLKIKGTMFKVTRKWICFIYKITYHVEMYVAQCLKYIQFWVSGIHWDSRNSVKKFWLMGVFFSLHLQILIPPTLHSFKYE